MLADWLPAGFAPLPPADCTHFSFEVLGPRHNAADLAAWSSSIRYISSIPGFGETWPIRVYTLAENLADLAEHAQHHAAGLDYAWTILAPGSREVIGCLYVKPTDAGPAATWWLSEASAALTPDLDALVVAWLKTWPATVAPRSTTTPGVASAG